MTILLHGQNDLASRNRLGELKESFKGEVVEITSPSEITQNALFANERLFVLWFDKKLSTTQIKSFQNDIPDLKIEEFKTNPVVFRFLESLQPAGQKKFLPLAQEYLKTDPPEVVSTMLARQFRLMLLAKLDQNSDNLAMWQLSRLKHQAALFSFDQLKNSLQKLLEIDFQQKSGQTSASFHTSLDLFLLSL